VRGSRLAIFSVKLSIAVFAVKAKAHTQATICGQSKGAHPSHPEVKKYGEHEFQPKIEVSIDIIDEKPFYEDKDLNAKYYLAIIDHELKIKDLPRDVDPNTLHYLSGGYAMWNAPRWLLKQLTKSGRLLGFLQHVAKTLEKMEAEYGEVADLAEKLAKALQPMWPPKSPSEIIP